MLLEKRLDKRVEKPFDYEYLIVLEKEQEIKNIKYEARTLLCKRAINSDISAGCKLSEMQTIENRKILKRNL